MLSFFSSKTFESIVSFGSSVFKNGLLFFLLEAIIGFWLVSWLSKSIIRYVSKNKENEKTFKTAQGFLINTVKVLSYGVLAIVLILNVIPLNSISSIVVGFSSIAAVVLGLAAQETLGNLIAGLLLAIYQPFHVDDTIILKEKNITGIVKSIGFRHTVLKTFDNTHIIVPNSVMNTAIVENRDGNERSYRNTFVIGISYDSDISKAKNIILKNIEAHPSLVDYCSAKEKKNNVPIVFILVDELGDFSVNIKALFHTKDVGAGVFMCSDLRESIKADFEKNGISIPFPTQTIFTKGENQ